MNLDSLKTAARGRWPEILSAVAGIDRKLLDGKHHPCPRCPDGGTDRFRLIDEAAGAVLCNQCFSQGNGDGIAAVQHFAGCDFLAACGKIVDYLHLDQSGSQGASQPKVVATFEYRDEGGKLLFYIDRRQPGDKGKPKDFKARSPSGGTTKGIRRVLYRLPELVNAEAAMPVFIPEGEKHVDTLRSLNLVATCNPFGAGSWKPEYNPSLAGRHVVIMPDNDQPGREHAKHVAESLAGIAASVKRVELPNLPDKGDVLDWLKAGGTKAELLKLAAAASDEGKSDTRPRSMAERLKEQRELHPPVIDRLAREGETVNVIAPPKTGKSWLVYSLALSIAAGIDWLDIFPTVRGKVLIIDNELHDATLDNRIPKVAHALRLTLEDYGEQLDIRTLRGQLKDIHALAAEFDTYQPGQYKAIIIDSFYRTLPPGTDENDNAAMAAIYNLIDKHALRLKSVFVLIHHSSKGNQADKAVTDVGSGAGSMSRATDTHFVMREHDEPNAVVADAAIRSFPPLSPFCLRWFFPVWTPDDNLDPANLKRPARRGKSRGLISPQPERKDRWTAKRFADAFVTPAARPKAAIIDDAVDADVSRKLAEKLLEAAIAKDLAYPWKMTGDKRKVLYANQPQDEQETLAL